MKLVRVLVVGVGVGAAGESHELDVSDVSEEGVVGEGGAACAAHSTGLFPVIVGVLVVVVVVAVDVAGSEDGIPGLTAKYFSVVAWFAS